jgi:hypothetical protein
VRAPHHGAWASRAHLAAGLGQRRKPPVGFKPPHVTGHRSAEVVALVWNWPNGPGNVFSIFDFFKQFHEILSKFHNSHKFVENLEKYKINLYESL